MKHVLVELLDSERARQERRLAGAEAELKRLRSEPIPAVDGDEDGSASARLQRARQIDRAELELERAQAAREALQALWVRFEEEQASDNDRPMVRTRADV